MIPRFKGLMQSEFSPQWHKEINFAHQVISSSLLASEHVECRDWILPPSQTTDSEHSDWPSGGPIMYL